MRCVLAKLPDCDICDGPDVFAPSIVSDRRLRRSVLRARVASMRSATSREIAIDTYGDAI
jgi:hypothetical protein